MTTYVLDVAGISTAVNAMRLSFNSESNAEELVESQGWNLFKDDHDLLLKLISNGDSHAKVTRMMQVWLELTLPRYMWQEFDTYKIGTTAMSESTAHTLIKQIKDGKLTVDSFEVTENNKEAVKGIIGSLYYAVDNNWSVEEVKQLLPESFLQKRIVNLNYQTLRHMYFDRRNHRLQSWKTLLADILTQLPFPEFITKEV